MRGVFTVITTTAGLAYGIRNTQSVVLQDIPYCVFRKFIDAKASLWEKPL